MRAAGNLRGIHAFLGTSDRFPLAWAFLRPALTHSTIRVHSSSATAPRTVKIIFPVGWTCRAVRTGYDGRTRSATQLALLRDILSIDLVHNTGQATTLGNESVAWNRF